jgi:hypothetical protein
MDAPRFIFASSRMANRIEFDASTSLQRYWRFGPRTQ